jgi:hypothetical protein
LLKTTFSVKPLTFSASMNRWRMFSGTLDWLVSYPVDID